MSVTQTGWGRRARALVSAAMAGLLMAQVSHADTVMITGANSGLGLELARQYAKAGWTVIATHRRDSTPRELADLGKQYASVRAERMNVATQAEVRALAQKLKDVPIDVLINNAGVYNDRSKCRGDDDKCPGDWETQTFGNMKFSLLDTMMAVNIKGPLIVSQAFYPNVKTSRQKKIVAISSSNGTLTGEKEVRGGTIFYRMTKAALNREMQIVAASVKKDGVTVIMFNPGPTLTEHQEYLRETYEGMLETSFTVGHMIRTTEKATIADTGKFLRYDGVTEPW